MPHCQLQYVSLLKLAHILSFSLKSHGHDVFQFIQALIHARSSLPLQQRLGDLLVLVSSWHGNIWVTRAGRGGGGWMCSMFLFWRRISWRVQAVCGRADSGWEGREWRLPVHGFLCCVAWSWTMDYDSVNQWTISLDPRLRTTSVRDVINTINTVLYHLTQSHRSNSICRSVLIWSLLFGHMIVRRLMMKC